MKKILLLVAFATSLFAVDGYKVYKDKCKVCHVEMMGSKEALANLDKLSAPPMIEVSTRLKDMIKLGEDDEDVKRELVLTFIRDYIINPSIDKSMCHLGALDRFDVMPSMKGKLTQAEINAVAEWVYDHYEGKKF
ncbi:MAG: c-type cytochrome [Thiovulaceae bacterium]|nr:c-type cytochrome [Sulfurimonadaceae bacterium]